MSGGLGKADLWFRGFQSRWVDRLQGDLVLPTTRTLYLAGAFVALGAVVLGLLATIWFQLSSLRPMPSTPARPADRTEAVAMSMGPVDARMSPPTNIRFVVDQGVISDPLTDNAILGHFEADTPNGLASPPDDFELIGGRDEALFVTSEAFVSSDSSRRDAAAASARRGTVLRAAPTLVDQINAERLTLAAQRVRSFEVRVLATDALGVNAPAQMVTFNLVYGPPGAAAVAAPAPIDTVAAPDTPLNRLAREIALIVDPARTATYFEAFDRAAAMPATCEADEATFVPQYRLAFDHVRPRLKASNVEAFYTGLCESWQTSVAQRQQARAEAQQQWAAKAARAEAAQIATATKRAIARTLRNAALIFVMGALATFMTIAVLLAFLAIEGHSKAVRQVVELLAAQNAQIVSERRP